LYVARSGCSLRQLPQDFPPGATVLGTSAVAGRWTVDRLHDALRDRVGDGAGRDPAVSPGIIDPQSVKAAGTVGFGSRGYDAGRTVNLRKGPRSESRPCPTPRFGSLSWDSSAAPAEAARVMSRRR
jgi:hypothetical protein